MVEATASGGGGERMLGQLILDKYRVTRLLDEGGMSKIYLARQVEPSREVVVKVLKDHLRASSKAVDHFRREIYITSRFEHPYAVTCYDYSTRPPAGSLLVMEYLRGVDLNTLLQREGRFAPERTGRLLVQLGEVLQAAHEKGIVHRDLKPGNIMVLHPGTPQETIKLMDFGLAKMSNLLYISPEDLIDFRLPAASGTPEYISPEMVRGNDLDSRGDLYSVGVILFELLTGRRPFLHTSVEGLMLAHAEEPPPSFARAGLPNVIAPAIESVVMSCLAKYPEDRPKDANELVASFEKALGRRITPPRQPTGSGRFRTTTAESKAVPIERAGYRHSVEAVMPESMAMLKLKGFVCDLGGELVESVPGMIKVRLAPPQEEKPTGGGLLGWLSGGTTANRQAAVLGKNQSTEIELHMERRDPTQPNKLTITLLMRPESGMMTVEWRNRCDRIGRDLQAYLMGR